ncbi:MAG: hypothetical protein K0R59_117 [Sphingobacterium sp.]|jgi:hypothetical protein|nr:hypothetical protein [Sphingobacterium sp.]
MEFIATGIDTEIFYSILDFLKQNRWKLDLEYDEKIFNKGIDFDLYQFSKDSDIITLAWDNWFEGEIKADKKILDELAHYFSFDLCYDESVYLHKIDLTDEMKGSIEFY